MNTSDETVMKFKSWFSNEKWAVGFETDNKSFRDSANVFVKDIKPRTNSSFSFSMTMHDSIGDSLATGIVVVDESASSQAHIMFEKTYINRSAAGQTGSFDLLLYRGVKTGEVINGRWSYEGYEANTQFAGSWRMAKDGTDRAKDIMMMNDG